MTSSRNSILQSISASLDEISLGESVGEPTSDPIVSIINFAKKNGILILHFITQIPYRKKICSNLRPSFASDSN